MALTTVASDFKASLRQCDNLIAHAHREDATGVLLLPDIDRRQITVAAFLNCFIAWETFLEQGLVEFLLGAPTLSGRSPKRFIFPRSREDAQKMIVGNARFFDFSNPDIIGRFVDLYFENGYPFQPTLKQINLTLLDLKSLRNAAAHMSATTQKAFQAAGLRLLGRPVVGMDLYDILTANSLASSTGGTVYSDHRDKLIVAADAITKG